MTTEDYITEICKSGQFRIVVESSDGNPIYMGELVRYFDLKYEWGDAEDSISDMIDTAPEELYLKLGLGGQS